MAERAGQSAPHVAVERDVLVRYLDAWTASALRSARGATYISSASDGFTTDAFGVFGEFADRLEPHHLDVVLLGNTRERAEPPPGLSVRTIDSADDLTMPGGPTLAHLDIGRLTEAGAWSIIAELGRGKGREVVLTSPPGAREDRERFHAAGLPCAVAVELVADDESARLLAFATREPKHLATFKNELWEVDEFAGIRYRDPRDEEHTLVDISETPQLLPLRRMLLAELARRGSCPVADLQRYTLLETIYRPADTLGALHSAAVAGEITREPEKGRLTSRTVVHPA